MLKVPVSTFNITSNSSSNRISNDSGDRRSLRNKVKQETALVSAFDYSAQYTANVIPGSHCNTQERITGTMSDYDDDIDTEGGEKQRNKSRRELPTGAVATLKAWLLSPEHFTHPYPTPQDQAMLMQKTGIDKKQLKNWFTNARRRIWKPMLKKQIEQGKLAATGVVGIPGTTVPGLMLPTITGTPTSATPLDNPHSIQAMRVHYQQAVQHQQQQHQQHQQNEHQQQHQHQQQQQQQAYANTDIFGNPMYPQTSNQNTNNANDDHQFCVPSPQPADSIKMNSYNSIGTLPQSSSTSQMTKTDSHAVLMELFARDQDLVRQATESARLRAESKQQQQQNQNQTNNSDVELNGTTSNQHPMKAPLSSGSSVNGSLKNVPTLNSWPHFSSITSLNNLGTMPGVKSIASMSGADLASKGSMNKMGNLAQVKSMENMGKNDSYAFLEVFFGGQSSNNLNAMGGRDHRSNKGGGDEDNDVGLSLEDEDPPQNRRNGGNDFASPAPVPSVPSQQSMGENGMESGTLKRAYDDAMAARGLMSVSRSCEKLTDLPAKMQRILSQDYLNKQGQVVRYSSYGYQGSDSQGSIDNGSHNGQIKHEDNGHCHDHQNSSNDDTDGHVQVPFATTCALCNQTNVDTQLRPCGHMFHERCLKPSFQTPAGPPKCPIDEIPMQSALLAVPTADSDIMNNKNKNNGGSTIKEEDGVSNKGYLPQPSSMSWMYPLSQDN